MKKPEIANQLDRSSLDDGAALIGGCRSQLRNPTGKAGQIVAVMEQRFAVGYYPSGEMLSFAMLAAEFGVSRQPVSAAIAHLRSAGYVEVIPHVGCEVVLPSPREIADFFFVLSKIESAIVCLAAARYEGDEAKRLMKITPPVGAATMAVLHQRKDYVAYIDRFHDQIWAMARSPLLEGKISGLRRLSHFYLWQGNPKLIPKASRQLARERAAIAKAIAARDQALASHLAEHHVLNKPRLLDITTHLA